MLSTQLANIKKKIHSFGNAASSQWFDSIEYSLGSIISNEQPREDARLRGGSGIKPWTKVPRQNESRRQCKVTFMT